ncbi:hypothetical protein Tco_1430898 [Tanacetum coccineum]
MQDGRRDNHTSKIYIEDDTPTCEPHEANCVQGYHRGYHDQNSRNSYSYLNHNPNRHYYQSRQQNIMPHPSQYFKIPKNSSEEMMKEWMAWQTEANEHDVLPNHVGDKELKSIDGVGNRVLTKTKIKKDEYGVPKELNKEWKLLIPMNRS